MIISYVALVVLLTLSFLAFEKLPVLEIKIPRYLNSIELLIYFWKLKVNVGKSKVVIFSKGRMSKNIVSMYNNTVLEIVNGGSMSLIT
jgi:hypothetical protein